MSDLQLDANFNVAQAKADLKKLNDEIKNGTGLVSQMNLKLKLLKVQFQSTSDPSKMAQLGNEIKKTTAALNSLNSVAKTSQGMFGGMAGKMVQAGVGVASRYQAFTMLKQEIVDSIKMSTQYQNAFIGAGSVAKKFGVNTLELQAAMMDLTKDGLMPMADAAVGLKNLMASGFSLKESIKLMNGFKDSASFNRQAALEFGEAIRSATEGIKNGNSILVDNAGITKNLSIILREAGHSERDLMKVVSDGNVRMALYNGLLKEMNVFQGDAATLTGTFAGKMSALTKATWDTEAAVGTLFQRGFTGTKLDQGLTWMLRKIEAAANYITREPLTEVQSKVPSEYLNQELAYYQGRQLRIEEEIDRVDKKIEKSRRSGFSSVQAQVPLYEAYKTKLQDTLMAEGALMASWELKDSLGKSQIQTVNDLTDAHEKLKFVIGKMNIEQAVARFQIEQDMKALGQIPSEQGEQFFGSVFRVDDVTSAQTQRNVSANQRWIDNYFKEQEAIIDGMQKIEDEEKQSLERREQANIQFAQNFTDVIGQSAANGFKGIEQMWKQMLKRMAAEAISMGLLSLLFPGAAAKGAFGFFGNLFSGKFDEGGYTGSGGKYEPAGVVHKGEVVWSQADVQRFGGVSAVEAIRPTAGKVKSPTGHYFGGGEVIPGGTGSQKINVNNVLKIKLDGYDVAYSLEAPNGGYEKLNRARGN